MTGENLLDAALGYAALGWRVLPLHHIEGEGCSCGRDDCDRSQWGKHPRESGWHKKATTNLDAIRRWWKKWPSANIGVAAGEKSNLLMIGPDGARGVADLALLEKELGSLPPTVRQASGSPPGFHLIFRYPAGKKVGNRRNHRGYSIDVRGEGGQFVAAPSRNVNGAYCWISPPVQYQEAVLPDAWVQWLLDDDVDDACEIIERSIWRGKITAVRPGPSVTERATHYLRECPGAISKQGGHNVAFAVVRSIVYGFDLGPDRGFDLLWDVWNPTCQPPWSEAELRHKCKDANEKEYRKPRGWLLGEDASRNGYSAARSTFPDSRDKQDGSQEEEPRPWPPLVVLPELPDVEDFPLGVFPAELQRFAGEVAWSLNCPIDFVAAPMLGVASGAVGNSRRLRITGSHFQPAVLFVCVIGAPGSGKSPALSLAVEPLEDAQRTEMVRYYRDKEELANSEEDGKKKALPPTRWLVDDTTQEALVKLLSENPRGMTMVRDELAALIKGMDQYRSGGKGNDRQNFLKLWSQETIRNDRKNNPDGCPVTVYRPFLSVVGGTQPTVVTSLRGESRKGEEPPDDGLVDRFLFSYPVCPAAAGESWREVSPSAALAWSNTIGCLISLQMGGDENRRSPIVVPLAESGRSAWSRFTDTHAAELNDENFPDNLKGLWAKLRGYAGRLALVIHCLREAAGERMPHGLDDESMTAGTALVAYFKSHARKVLVAMDADRTVAKAKRILRWLLRERPAEFKRYELFGDVKNRTHFSRPESLDAPLARLVKLNYLRIRERERATRGRPEVETYEVHPSFYETVLFIPGIRKSPPDNPSEAPSDTTFPDSRDSPDGFQGSDWLPD